MNVTTHATSSAVLPPNASEGIAVGFFGRRTCLPKGTSSVHPLAHVYIEHAINFFLLIFLFFKELICLLSKLIIAKKKSMMKIPYDASFFFKGNVVILLCYRKAKKQKNPLDLIFKRIIFKGI
jgi:hypothetical protein